MEMKRFFGFVTLMVALVLGVSACTRSLAPGGSPTATVPSVDGGVPGATDDVMDTIWQLATQTALAQQGEAGQPTIEATAIPTEGGEEPAPAEETTPTTEEQPAEATPVPTDTTAPPAVVVPTATPGLPSTYTLRSGEFPFCIARRFNVNQYELLNASGLTLNSRPSAGYQLTIPQTGNSFSGNRVLRAHPTTHTVGSGETANSIACLYGDVSPDAILFANSFSSADDLRAGQQIQIP